MGEKGRVEDEVLVKGGGAFVWVLGRSEKI